ncbi:MAG: hypothetical protein ACLRP8_08820 [Roseburia intestinalis]
MNRFIITTTEIEKKEYRIAALCDARQKLIEVTTESMTGTSVLGNIYIGRVENVVKNLNAAFVCIAPGQNCYPPAAGAEKSWFLPKTIRKKSNLSRVG